MNSVRTKMTLDEIVSRCIQNQFPNSTIPDEDNYFPNGNQFPAPDHHIPEHNIYIERKSLNPNKADIFKKINKIAHNQGHPGFSAFGIVEISTFIKRLPDPVAGNKEFGDYMMSQMDKRLKNACKKMKEFYTATNNTAPSILIISDHDTDTTSTDYVEQQLARKIVEGSNRIPGINLIQCIMYLKLPEYVNYSPGSSWCKILVDFQNNEQYREPVLQTVNSITRAMNQELHRLGLLIEPDKWDTIIRS